MNLGRVTHLPLPPLVLLHSLASLFSFEACFERLFASRRRAFAFLPLAFFALFRLFFALFSRFFALLLNLSQSALDLLPVGSATVETIWDFAREPLIGCAPAEEFA